MKSRWPPGLPPGNLERRRTWFGIGLGRSLELFPADIRRIGFSRHLTGSTRRLGICLRRVDRGDCLAHCSYSRTLFRFGPLNWRRSGGSIQFDLGPLDGSLCTLRGPGNRLRAFNGQVLPGGLRDGLRPLKSLRFNGGLRAVDHGALRSILNRWRLLLCRRGINLLDRGKLPALGRLRLSL